MSDRIERIRFYERIFDELSECVNVHTSDVYTSDARMDELKQKFEMLEQYYTSGLWREDYEADEQGLLPDDLKRGVLSQDSVYDLLGRYSHGQL